MIILYIIAILLIICATKINIQIKIGIQNTKYKVTIKVKWLLLKKELNKAGKIKISSSKKISISKIPQILNKIKFEKIYLATKIGLVSSLGTILATVSTNSIINTIIYRYMHPKKTEILVIPDFSKIGIEIKGECIFSVKIIHIIYMLITIKKEGKENGRTSNKWSYEHGDGKFKRINRRKYNNR